jgi:hypothetical protein
LAREPEPRADLRARERRAVHAGAHRDHLAVDRRQRREAAFEVVEHGAQPVGAGTREHRRERSAARCGAAAAKAAEAARRSARAA